MAAKAKKEKKLPPRMVTLGAMMMMEIYIMARDFTNGKKGNRKEILIVDRIAIRRVIRTIEGNRLFEKTPETRRFSIGWCPVCKAETYMENGDRDPRCEKCEGEMHVHPKVEAEFGANECSWTWDQIKAEIPMASMGRIEEIEIFADAFGYADDFRAKTQAWEG